MKKIISKIALPIFLIGTSLSAQNDKPIVEHFLRLKSQFFQIEEGANYGLVFDGFNLNCEYDFSIKNTTSIFNYSSEFGFGPGFDQGIIGLNWSFKPIDSYYGFNSYNGSDNKIFLGPYFATNYKFQLYPELQSGHIFWFTYIDIGPRLVSEIRIWDYLVNLSVSNSFAGFVSRPEVNPLSESTFYTLNFWDWISKFHNNFKFGSFNLMNHTNIKVEIPNFVKNGLSLTYEFEYYGYFEKSKLNYISHGLNLTWCIGSNKEEE